jgi:hypothetical protein
MSLTLHRECGVSIVKSLLFNDHSRDHFRYRRIQTKRPSQSTVMPPAASLSPQLPGLAI